MAWWNFYKRDPLKKKKIYISRRNFANENDFGPASVQLNTEIEQFESAVNLAAQKNTPITVNLQNYYSKAAQDGVVASAIKTRISEVLKRSFLFVDKNTNEVYNSTELNIILKSPWFKKLCKYCLESIYF